MSVYNFTSDEQTLLVAQLRQAAMAQARFWDLIHEIENREKIEIEIVDDFIGQLSQGCDTPKGQLQLSDEEIWEMFKTKLQISP